MSGFLSKPCTNVFFKKQKSFKKIFCATKNGWKSIFTFTSSVEYIYHIQDLFKTESAILKFIYDAIVVYWQIEWLKKKKKSQSSYYVKNTGAHELNTDFISWSTFITIK